MNYIIPLLLIIPSALFENPIHIAGNTNKNQYIKPIIRYDEASITYQDLLDEAVFNCKYRKLGKIDHNLLDKLIEIEKKYSPPPELKGLILAAACHESGYNPQARGDHRFSKSGKVAKAHGLFQMWPWWEHPRRGYGINRSDPMQSADAWMKHIVKQIKHVKKSCKYRTEKKIWIAAWVRAIRAPSKNGRCRETPKHYRLLKRWHKNILQRKEIKRKCESDGCGC